MMLCRAEPVVRCSGDLPRVLPHQETEQYTGLPACVCCRIFTGLNVDAHCKPVSEMLGRWRYVTRSAWL
jgi:hypothetical protein